MHQDTDESSSQAVNGVFYAIGGLTGSLGVREAGLVQEYEVRPNKWIRGSAKLRVQRKDLTRGIVDGLIHAVGGSDTATGIRTQTKSTTLRLVPGVSWRRCLRLAKVRSPEL